VGSGEKSEKTRIYMCIIKYKCNVADRLSNNHYTVSDGSRGFFFYHRLLGHSHHHCYRYSVHSLWSCRPAGYPPPPPPTLINYANQLRASCFLAAGARVCVWGGGFTCGSFSPEQNNKYQLHSIGRLVLLETH
jgi:hypothetical protein